jgi:hypothetical protein
MPRDCSLLPTESLYHVAPEPDSTAAEGALIDARKLRLPLRDCRIYIASLCLVSHALPCLDIPRSRAGPPNAENAGLVITGVCAPCRAAFIASVSLGVLHCRTRKLRPARSQKACRA